jgi:hypothetical protein
MITALLCLSAGTMIGFMLGALMKGGSNYSRGFDAGFAVGAEAALGEPLDGHEVIPAEGSPFVRTFPQPTCDIYYNDGSKRSFVIRDAREVH